MTRLKKMMLRACGYRPAPWMEPFWVSERLKITPHSLSRNARMTKPKAIATSAMMEATKRRVCFCIGGGMRLRSVGEGGDEVQRAFHELRDDAIGNAQPLGNRDFITMVQQHHAHAEHIA